MQPDWVDLEGIYFTHHLIFLTAIFEPVSVFAAHRSSILKQNQVLTDGCKIETTQLRRFRIRRFFLSMGVF